MSFIDAFIYFIYLLTVYSRTNSSSRYVCVNYLMFNEQNFHSFSFNSIGWARNNEFLRVWKWLWHKLKYYPSNQGQWYKPFLEIKEQQKNSRRHRVFSQQGPYWGLTHTPSTNVQNLVTQDICIPGWGQNNHEVPVSITNLQAQIWTWHQVNKHQDC